ncbi:MAG: carboxylating nicotinate-nucleotide diphosphorylase [Chthonomonadales bacterium]|nr:carboxylating nicotinate-nucleotide diphosphorylase [Chthonomonadales bacterium]
MDPGLREAVRLVARRALAEDVGTGDVTTTATVPADARGVGVIVARQEGIVAGLDVAAAVFRRVDGRLRFSASVRDGDRASPGTELCEVRGSARSILTGERVALNLLQRLCGIATLTARFVEAVSGTPARIVDTRKTTPGLRALEKYAVTVGGGRNHRMGLYDSVLIKDNHLVAAGGVAAAVGRARAAVPHTMTITVECETLAQVDEAMTAGADILLLDNMDDPTRAEAVCRARGRALTEASGGITLATAADIARTGVQILSIGALTHSAPALDISLDLREERQ